jgi:hypothetical protein
VPTRKTRTAPISSCSRTLPPNSPGPS